MIAIRVITNPRVELYTHTTSLKPLQQFHGLNFASVYFTAMQLAIHRSKSNHLCSFVLKLMRTKSSIQVAFKQVHHLNVKVHTIAQVQWWLEQDTCLDNNHMTDSLIKTYITVCYYSSTQVYSPLSSIISTLV